jgi:hypothetical protein
MGGKGLERKRNFPSHFYVMGKKIITTGERERK